MVVGALSLFAAGVVSVFGFALMLLPSGIRITLSAARSASCS
jgi:hypothetical protein